jgi:hypothetical protein
VEPPNEDDEIGKTHKFSLNSGFKRYRGRDVEKIRANLNSKKMKVQINVPVPQQVREESDSTHKFVEEDRKLQVRAFYFAFIISFIFVYV